MKREEYINRLQKAINFIEKNIDEEIKLSDVSKKAFSSLSHFHRIFSFMTGISLKEYIRKRKLSIAAEKLLLENRKIIDIAFEAVYHSSESFQRAFKEMFLCNPSYFRKNPSRKKLFPVFKIEELIKKQKNRNMEIPKLSYVLLNSAKIYGLKIKTSLKNNKLKKDIPKFYKNCLKKNYFIDIIPSIKTKSLYGIYKNMTDEEDFTYMLGYECTENLISNYKIQILPKGKYACFEVIGGNKKLANAWKYIYGIWFIESEQEREKGLDFEIYSDNKTEIFIPLKNI